MTDVHNDQSLDRRRRERRAQQGKAALGRLDLVAADVDDRGQADVLIAGTLHRSDVPQQGGHRPLL
eukprot:15285161-Alexandrium_andersonii.AAC.1